jgi:hypothetical protein
MRVTNYHIGKLKGQNPTSAQVCQHRDGKFYIHIQLKLEAPKLKKPKMLSGLIWVEEISPSHQQVNLGQVKILTILDIGIPEQGFLFKKKRLKAQGQLGVDVDPPYPPY